MPVMDPDRCEDSGEMYSPDDQGEYTSLEDLRGRICPDVGSDDG